MTDKLRLTILGGYLGSGKTTWLRHQLHEGSFGRRAHVLVNEAAGTGVDDALLAAPAGVTLLAGGCACCAGRAALIAALRRLADRRSQAAPDAPERVLLETSGLADPTAIVAAIQADPVLISHVRLDEIVIAVDGLHGLAALCTSSLGRRQVAAADRLVLTKTDAVATADLATLRATLARLAPGARQMATVLGQPVPLATLPADTAPALLAATTGADPAPARIALPPDLDWSLFALWLSALLHARGNDLVRVKGVVTTPAGRLLLQTVRRTVQAPEILPGASDPARDDVIVFIGSGYRPADLVRSMQRFLGLGVPPRLLDQARE